MRLNKILAPLTIVMFGLTVFIVADHIRTRSGDQPLTSTESTGNSEESVSPPGRSLLSGSQKLLVTGVSSRIPEASDYRLLKAVPWEHGELSRLFRDAGAELSCQLLDPGNDVVQPFVEPTSGLAGPLGRSSAFAIRLQVGKSLGEGLPSVTRGFIEDYLKAHQLMIQPTYYHDEQSQLILGPRLRAAFVRLDAPLQTTAAEPMIVSSIGELRTLGAYWIDVKPFSPASCRTLVLGFRYTLDVSSGTERGNPKREYELLFLHLLPGSTSSRPRLACFATSDARTQFHLLEENDPATVDQRAAITADVRFADSRVAGMYPADPVVTRVYHRAILSIPVDLVKSRIAGLGGKVPEDGFSGVLDELYRSATGTDTPVPAVSGPPTKSDPRADAAPSTVP
jgi:hypothetical protein